MRLFLRTNSLFFVHGLFMLLIGMFFIAPKLFGQDRDEQEGESGDEIIARQKYFYERRAGGPGKILQEDAYEQAVYQKQQLEKNPGHLQHPALVGSWTSVNPSGMFYARTNANYIAGRTNVIAFHPTNPAIMYAGAAGGGVWKTTNGGVLWRPLTDSLSALTCGAVAIDPLNPNTVYVGTGELNYSLDSYYGDGIFKSTDAGISWAKIATTVVGRYFSQIAIDPTNPNVVYIAGSNGVYKSTDAGTTWNTTNSGTNANCVLLVPTNPQTLYTTTGGTGGNVTRKSTDGGASWSSLGNGLPGSSTAGRTQIAMAPSNSNILYASISNRSGNSLLGLYRSTDSGSSWTFQASSPNYLGGQGWYDNAITVHATNPDIVFAGGLDVYSSTNAGVTLVQRSSWSTTTSTNMSHADIHFLGYNNGVLFCGSDGGVYKSTNDGVNWSDLNATLSTLQFQSADYDPTNPMRLYGGTQDNNLETSTDGGGLWIQRTTGDGGYSIVDPVTSNYVYGQYVNGSVKRSNNYGVSFTDIEPSGSTGGLFYNPYEMAPTDHNIIVYAQADVWKTTNAQTATSTSGWTQIASTSTIGGNASAIGIAGNPDKIFIGTSNGNIHVTVNNGSTWMTRSGFPYVTDLFVDDLNDDICYASTGGTTAGSHVFKTTNGGNAWVNITGNLPNVPVNTIVVRTAAPRMIFLGTDIGVFVSTNEGSSWAPFGSGLPAVTVFDLKYKLESNILLAATHGRGCFKYVDLPPPPGVRIGLSPSSFAFGNIEAGRSSDTVTVRLDNRGSDTLVISSISNSVSSYVLLNLPSLPVRVPALGNVQFKVVCRPTAHGALVDTIRIASNDPNNATVRVSLSAKGIVIGRARAGILYAVSATQTAASQLYAVNTSSGLATAIGPTSLSELDGLTIRRSSKELYGTLASSASTTVYRVSEQFGDVLSALTVGIPNLRAIAFSPGDTLYGGTTTGQLYRINPATGDTVLIGTSGLAYSGFSFSPVTRELWASVRPPISNRDKIYKVNTATGVATLVGGTGDNAITPSLAFDPDGKLFGLKGSSTQTNTLIRIDTTNGAGTTVGSLGIAGALAIAMRTDTSATLAVHETGNQIPQAFQLHQNYPNPFNPTTTITFDLPVTSFVSLKIFDVVGREVAVLANGIQSAGFKSVSFDADNFASGIYLYRLAAGGYVATKKLILMK